MSLLIRSVSVLAATLGLSLVSYTTAVLVGGGGNIGEEDAMLGQYFIGFLLLILVHLSGVLY